MFFYFSREVTISKAKRFERPYQCQSCGYRARTRLRAVGHGSAEDPFFANKQQALREASELAEFSAQDEAQLLLDLVPCPRCGSRSENASLYRQNTVLAAIGAMAIGASIGGYMYAFGGEKSRLFWISSAIGVLVGGLIGYVRQRYVATVADAVEFLPEKKPRTSKAG